MRKHDGGPVSGGIRFERDGVELFRPSNACVRMPDPPSCRHELTGLGGSLWFNSFDELQEYKQEPLWRRVLGCTKYHERLMRIKP